MAACGRGVLRGTVPWRHGIIVRLSIGVAITRVMDLVIRQCKRRFKL